MPRDDNGKGQQKNAPNEATSDSAASPQREPEEERNPGNGGDDKVSEANGPRVFGFPLLDFFQTLFDGLLLVSAVVGSYWISEQLEITRQQVAASQDSAIGQQRATNRALTIAQSQADASSQLVRANEQLAATAGQQVMALHLAAAANVIQSEQSISQADSLRRQAATSQKQAEALDAQRATMEREAASMSKLADANKLIAEAATASAAAAGRMAETSAKQLETADRALVEIEATIQRDVTFAAPFNWKAFPKEQQKMFHDIAGDLPWVFVFPTFKISNAGRSVANNLMLRWQIVPRGPTRMPPPNAMLDVFEWRKLAATVCEQSALYAQATPGESLFPAATTTRLEGSSERIPTDEIYPPSAFSVTRPSTSLYIVGCAAYDFPNSLHPHRTWFTYQVEQVILKQRTMWPIAIFEIGETVPASRLALRKLPEGSGAD